MEPRGKLQIIFAPHLKTGHATVPAQDGKYILMFQTLPGLPAVEVWSPEANFKLFLHATYFTLMDTT